jgi:hypothetical protein
LLSVEGTDPAYEALRRPSNDHSAECRAILMRLWEEVAPFLDDNLVKRARIDLHSAFWEMHVAAGLIEAGATLVPRDQRTPRKSGPDLLCQIPYAWIEVVAAKPGSGRDAVPESPEGVAYSVPDDQILLRITQAIRQKRAKRDMYLSKGWVRNSDPFIIAVNSGIVPNGKSELPLPRIIRAVFPFGHFAVSMDVTSGRITDQYYQHRSVITKVAGSPVSTALFEDESYSGISACLYSVTDSFNPPRSWARSLVLVHNPLATAPLPRGCFCGVLEYWREGDRLHTPGP